MQKKSLFRLFALFLCLLMLAACKKEPQGGDDTNEELFRVSFDPLPEETEEEPETYYLDGKEVVFWPAIGPLPDEEDYPDKRIVIKGSEEFYALVPCLVPTGQLGSSELTERYRGTPFAEIPAADAYQLLKDLGVDFSPYLLSGSIENEEFAVRMRNWAAEIEQNPEATILGIYGSTFSNIMATNIFGVVVVYRGVRVSTAQWRWFLLLKERNDADWQQHLEWLAQLPSR